jgi:hypothetical protein
MFLDILHKAIGRAGRQNIDSNDNPVHRFQKAKAWDDRKKQERLEKLLMQMEAILAEN